MATRRSCPVLCALICLGASAAPSVGDPVQSAGDKQTTEVSYTVTIPEEAFSFGQVEGYDLVRLAGAGQ